MTIGTMAQWHNNGDAHVPLETGNVPRLRSCRAQLIRVAINALRDIFNLINDGSPIMPCQQFQKVDFTCRIQQITCSFKI